MHASAACETRDMHFTCVVVCTPFFTKMNPINVLGYTNVARKVSAADIFVIIGLLSL